MPYTGVSNLIQKDPSIARIYRAQVTWSAGLDIEQMAQRPIVRSGAKGTALSLGLKT
ncbi:hypothetical protein [Denitrobaculum tricleocarpae]|uniref:hypothetical protein n=1 Tax=Denitrobaculum tricleocarpae TaxID=2591009 RepID=UPI0015D3EA48|nr:hypothetical protein [Denitrobaculum tricleocarpae]